MTKKALKFEDIARNEDMDEALSPNLSLVML